MDKKIDSSTIRREALKRYIKWSVGIAVVAAVIIAVLVMMGKSVRKSDLTFGDVTMGSLETTVSASGKAVPAYEEIINSPVDSRIVAVYAHAGDSNREKVEQVLERLEMTHRIKHLPTQLSGGQCQRVAIARAMVGAPQIILADEPTGNLDSKMGAEVMELLHKLNKEDGTTIVMVTHNESQARDTERLVRFFDGRIIS